MKKKTFKFFLMQTLRIFAIIVISGIIIFSSSLILYYCNVDLGEARPVVLIALTLGASAIISGVMVAFTSRRGAKQFVKVKESLDRIASGDFTHKLELPVRNAYMREIVDSINKISSELSSTAILKNDFVRNFSHEFKTPIVSIKGFSELLCNDKSLTEEEKEKYYRIIYEESERLANLANMTLLLSKLDSQSIVVDMEEFFVDEQIEECAMQFYRQVEQKNIDVNIELEHISCYASKELLRELWLNLLSNAVKYTKENGHIKIYSYGTPTGYAVCVQDDGIGISDEARAHIFDEYYQEDNSTHNKGIGLGLSICKRIVDIHGFDISVTSSKDRGSAFIVNINRKKEE